jgi:hypothetical protein
MSRSPVERSANELQFSVRELSGRLLEHLLTDRPPRQRPASPQTIASFRKVFRLVLKFATLDRTRHRRVSYEAVETVLIAVSE